MCKNFVERHSFRTFSGDSPKTIRKLCPSTKFPYQEIRWKHVILHNLTYYCQENLARDSFSVSDISSEINLNSADESAVVDHAISNNFASLYCEVMRFFRNHMICRNNDIRALQIGFNGSIISVFFLSIISELCYRCRVSWSHKNELIIACHVSLHLG